MSASSDLNVVATGGRDLRILVRRLPDMDRFDTLYGHEGAPCGLTLSPDGSTAVSWDFGSSRSNVWLWDTVRVAARAHVPIRGRVFAVFFTPEGPIGVAHGIVAPLVRSEADRDIRIPTRLNLVSLTESRVVGGIPTLAKLVSTTPDGAAIVTATRNGTVTVFHRRGAR